MRVTRQTIILHFQHFVSYISLHFTSPLFYGLWRFNRQTRQNSEAFLRRKYCIATQIVQLRKKDLIGPQVFYDNTRRQRYLVVSDGW